MDNIGKVIYAKIKDVFGGRCYPIVAEETTKMPFAVYQRESTTVLDTKDRYICSENHNVQISIVTDKYNEGVTLMEEVVEIMDNFQGIVGDIEVLDTTVTSINEAYANAYVQYINLTIKT